MVSLVDQADRVDHIRGQCKGVANRYFHNSHKVTEVKEQCQCFHVQAHSQGFK